MSDEQQAAFSGWARVEVMGHQTHIGFVRTEAYGAAVLFRIDQPELPAREYVLTEPAFVEVVGGCESWQRAGAKVQRPAVLGCSVLVGAASIYRIIPCSEEAALKAIDATMRPNLKLVEPPPPVAGIEGPADAFSDIPSELPEYDEDDDEDDDEKGPI